MQIKKIMKENVDNDCTKDRREVKYMKKISIITLIITVIAISLIAFTNSAYAYRGDPTATGPYHTEEREAAMDKAFDNNDYNAWKNLMNSRGRVTQVINKDNFAQFAKAHKLAEEGKIAEANQIRTQLGLGLQNGNGQKMGMRMGRFANK
jgi:hypothetical protein